MVVFGTSVNTKEGGRRTCLSLGCRRRTGDEVLVRRGEGVNSVADRPGETTVTATECEDPPVRSGGKTRRRVESRPL